MAEKKLFLIIDWDQNFEKAQTRKSAANHTWVAMPNKHDGLGFKKLMNHDRGLEVFAIWVLLVQIASKTKIRGILADDDGEPYTFEDFSILVGRTKEEFEFAIGVLISIKWVSQSIATAVVDRYQCSGSAVVEQWQRVGSVVPTTIQTIQDNTEQTIQNKTAFFPDSEDSQNDSIKMFSKNYRRIEVFKIVAAAIPKNRIKTPVLLCASIVAAINRSNATNEKERNQAAHLLAERMGVYYNSSEGKGGHHKDPHNWLDEDRHLVDVSAWESRSKTSAKDNWTELESDNERKKLNA